MRTTERGARSVSHSYRTVAPLQAVDALDAAPPLRYAVQVGIYARNGATARFRPWRSGGSGMRRDGDIAVERIR